MKKYRQGEVYILECEKVEDLKEVDSIVFAEGEVTGHRHVLVAERPDTKLRMKFDGVDYYFEVVGGNAVVKHEEHKTITLTPGFYRSVIQREYDPIAYQRQVRD